MTAADKYVSSCPSVHVQSKNAFGLETGLR